MTRVLMVSSLWPPAVIGGAELYAARLADELRRRGHVVEVVTLGLDGPHVAAAVTPWPYPLQSWAAQPRWKRALFHAADVYRPATARTIRNAIDDYRPDVVHTHAVQGMSVAALTAPSLAGCPHVHSLHDYWLLCQRTTLRTRRGRRCQHCSMCGLISAFRRTALGHSQPDVYLAPSNALAAQHAVDPRIRQRLQVVRHPADLGPPRRHRVPSAGDVTFGFLGQLTPVKGLPTLLAAFAGCADDARARSARVRLLVAGRGPLGDEVRRHESAGVEALGWLDPEQKEGFFDAIDCLVVPSEWEEPAGLVVVEAAARGVPVIGAASGGIPEYVAPSSQRWLFRPGAVDDLRRVLCTFATSPPQTTTDRTDHLPTWPTHVDQVVEAYRQAGDRSARMEVAM
jgi:glycosyltransferase involved in cell wall biosynthesis